MTPVQVMNGYAVAAVAAGNYHSLFVTTSGGCFATGLNGYGQLGDGRIEWSYLSPTPCMSAYTVAAVASGSEYSLFVTTSGECFAAGRNDYGQLGDSTQGDRNTPVQVMVNYTVAAVDTQTHHSLFITTSGQCFAAGRNDYGQLGDGTTTDRYTPVQVMTEYTVAAVAAGHYHSLFVTTNGECYATGYNANGQLGDGTFEHKNLPVAVMSAYTIAQADAGQFHSVFITTQGHIYGTGDESSLALCPLYSWSLTSYNCGYLSTPKQLLYTGSKATAGGDSTFFICKS
ncbi:hypothetical protein CYMTET_46754 [Cymbomonas tetramitiformis]|nr:hypothetical protein CYMTET_46754 [Cymbomonas tetramitiformis]